jgi:hypothetical protein
MQAALYVRDDNGGFWGPKPVGNSAVALAPDFSWVINNWWSNPADASIPSLAVVVFRVDTGVPALAGENALPPSVTAVAAATLIFPRPLAPGNNGGTAGTEQNATATATPSPSSGLRQGGVSSGAWAPAEGHTRALLLACGCVAAALVTMGR